MTAVKLNTSQALEALAAPVTEPNGLAELARQALGVDAVIFWTRRGDQLLTYAIAPPTLSGISVDMGVGEGVAGKVARDSDTIIVKDMLDREELAELGVRLHHAPVVIAQGWRAGMFIPVNLGSTMLGVFGAYARRLGALRKGLQEDVFGAFANRVASELHRDVTNDDFNRVVALGLAAIDRAHHLDNTVFALQKNIADLARFYRRRMEINPQLGTPEIRRLLATIEAQSREVGSNFQALIHEDRLRRSSAIRLEPLEPILTAVAARHQGMAAQASITLAVECQQRVAAYVSRHDFDRVMDNLVTNAVQFHPQRRSRDRHKRAGNWRYIRLSAAADTQTGRTTVLVEDNGPGIPQDEIPFIFDLMWSSPRSSGSGFGLFFARRIVEAFGGEISVVTQFPGPTSFAISLRR